MAGVPQLDDRITTVVFEALETVASPEVAVDIVTDALTGTGLEGPPGTPALLRRFIADHLWPAVAGRLGPEAADIVSERLSLVADSWELTDSHVRRKRRVTADYSEPPRAAAQPSVVLLVTSDPGLAQDLGELLGGSVQVSQACDSIDLLRKLEDVTEQRCALVVDCLTSPIPLKSLVTSAPYLPEEAPVVLWRANEEVSLDEVPRSRALRWSVLRPQSRIEDRVSPVGYLLGPGYC